MLNNIWAQKSSVFFWYLTKAQSDGSCPITCCRIPLSLPLCIFSFIIHFISCSPLKRRQPTPQVRTYMSIRNNRCKPQAWLLPTMTDVHTWSVQSQSKKSRAWAISNTSCATGPRSNILKEARRSWRSVYHQYDYNLYDLGSAWVAGRLCRLLCTCTFPNI